MLASACGMYGQDFNKMVDGLIDKSVPLIYPDSLSKLQSEGKSIVILDAREIEEYNVSHIDGAKNVGYKDFEIEDFNIDKDAEIVVYCSVGYRSEKVGEELRIEYTKLNSELLRRLRAKK